MNLQPACCRDHTWIEKSCLLNGSTSSDPQSGHRTVHVSVCAVTSLWRGSVQGSPDTFELGLQPTLGLLGTPQTQLSIHSETPVELMKGDWE